jgi:hypothetical protein
MSSRTFNIPNRKKSDVYMKNFILLVSVLSLAVVANASDAKKASRKPAGANGVVQFSRAGNGASFVITGDAAQDLYDAMTVTPSTEPGAAKTGRGIVCKKNTDAAASAYCQMDFSDLANGVIAPTGPWNWAAQN